MYQLAHSLRFEAEDVYPRSQEPEGKSAAFFLPVLAGDPSLPCHQPPLEGLVALPMVRLIISLHGGKQALKQH